MKVERQPGGCIRLVHSLDELTKSYLLISDVHYDNPKCNRKLLKQHLDLALEKDAGILIGGDLFCVMQGKYDPRRNKGDIEDAFNVPNYLDNLIDKVGEFLEPYKKNIVTILQGNHECLDDKTEVLTSEGWKLFKDLNRNEFVATVNLDTKEVEWQKPTDYHTSHYTGKLHSIKARCFDLMMTPNHRVIHETLKDKHLKVQESQKLSYSKGSNIRFPVAAKSSNAELPGISDLELQLLGWILSDGGVHQYGGYPSVKIYQASQKINTVLDIVKALGYEHTLQTRERTIDNIQGKELIKKTNTHYAVNIMGEGRNRIMELLDHKKLIPDWMQQLSDRQFEVFLSSFIDGDGSRHKNTPTSWMAYGIKETLDRLQALCITHGFRASLSTYRSVHFRLNITRHTTHQLASIKNRFSEVDYDGNVYCVTVPNSSIYVRRNGYVCITGNSNVLNRLETNLTSRLIDALDPNIQLGGYQGFIRFQFNVSDTSKRTITMFYHHGGPGGVVTRAVPWVARFASMAPDAKIVWTGDSHDRYEMEHPQLRLTQNGKMKVIPHLHIKTGTYKQEYEQDGGWAIEKIIMPKSLGGYWLTFQQDDYDVTPRATMT